jgi:hypothetical protein
MIIDELIHSGVINACTAAKAARCSRSRRRPAHFDKTKRNADEHGQRRCDIRDCSQIHDDNLLRCEKIKSRRIISTLRLSNY